MTTPHTPDSDPDTPQAIHRRITENLNALLPTDPTHPPHPYIRHHLMDHAVQGHAVDDHHIPADFIPWDQHHHIRNALGLPITPTPTTATLAAWAHVEPYLNDTSPATRALSLDFARTITNQPPQHRSHSPGLRPTWAHWTTTPNILAHNEKPITTLTRLPLPDGRTLLATGSIDGRVRLWDPATGTQVGNPLTGHDGWVWAVAAVPMPDGRTLIATGGDDGRVRLWDPATGTQVGNPLTGHRGGVWAVAAVPMPDGRTLIATGGIDRTVRFWDPATGTQIGNPLTGHRGGVRAMAAVPTPDGRTLIATSSDDGTVRLWDPTTQSRYVQLASGSTVRSLVCARVGVEEPADYALFLVGDAGMACIAIEATLDAA